LAKGGFTALLIGLALMLSPLGGMLEAQGTTGNIYGVVRDAEGGGLPGVILTLRAPGIEARTESNERGVYRFIGLSPSIEYEITAELAGFKKTTRTGVVLQARSNVEINLILEVSDDKRPPVIYAWRAARAAFDKFVSAPSPVTAREFHLSISEERCPKGDKTTILDYIFGTYTKPPLLPGVGRFRVIEAEMLNGDLSAARSVIRILGFIENEWQPPPGVKLPIRMQVGAALGALMRANPTLYLKACYLEKESEFLKEKGLPYGYVPFILHMKKTMASYEMEMRKEALRTVEDPELISVRDECLHWIEHGTRFMESMAQERPALDVPDGKGSGVAQETVKKVLMDMVGRPDQENMRKVLDLLDERKKEFPYLMAALFSLIGRPDQTWPPQKPFPDPLGIILHEATCGNTYAVGIVFAALVPAFLSWDDLASLTLAGFISNLMLMRPDMFIENVAKLGYLDSQLLDTAPITFLDWICGHVDFNTYPDANAKETILRRRIAALEDLKMPERRNLIDRCILLIEKNLGQPLR
jgi:hypothetical protein